MFAAGVILYILLCGYPPFNSKSVRQLFVRTVKGAYKLSGPEWDSISPEAKDLVRKMLDISPETRITTQEILAHPWITKAIDVAAEHLADSSPLGVDALSNKLYADGLIGKSSVLHGHLLQKSLTGTEGTSLETAQSTHSAHSAHSSTSNDVNLSRALDHLADHIKGLKTEKLAKTVTRLMIAKHTAGGSKLAALYLVPYDKHRAAAGAAKSPLPVAAGVSQRLSVRAMPPMAPIAEETSELDTDNNSVNSGTPEGADSTSTPSTQPTPTSRVSKQSAPVVSATGNKYDELQQMMNSEAKESVTVAMFDYFGADEHHRLTMEQFIYLLKKFGLMGANTTIPPMESIRNHSNNSTKDNNDNKDNKDNKDSGPLSPTAATSASGIANVGLFGMLVATFADRDNKGFITPEDFFTAQVMILQQNELYLRALFKQYQHSVWYPGRQTNFNNAVRSLTGGSRPVTPACTETPGAALLKRLSDSDLMDDKGSEGPSPQPASDLDYPLSYALDSPANASAHRSIGKLDIEFEPPEYITAKHVSAVFERFGFDPRAGHKVFTILCDALAKLNRERRLSSHGNSPMGTPRQDSGSMEFNGPAEPSSPTAAAPSEKDSNKSAASSTIAGFFGSLMSSSPFGGASEDHLAPSSPAVRRSADIALPPPELTPVIQQMNMEDFIQANKMDEVLSDVFSKDAHRRMFTLFQKVELKYQAMRELLEGSDDPAAADKLAKVVRQEVAVVLDDPLF